MPSIVKRLMAVNYREWLEPDKHFYVANISGAKALDGRAVKSGYIRMVFRASRVLGPILCWT